ncbi:MAG: response regulator [Burkholderiaceae bacterium]|nr:response regulator [Sulfuritalea sp.]MCF8175928.1 response regulator [Burkholderiaceae bacterium]MCF8184979.1 response regulator [Polynucleobacter sp.]
MNDTSDSEQDAAPRPTLLVVDDEDGILSSLKRLLRREAYQVLTANSGQAGLDELARCPVDVIVSDQRMPGMSGVEFLRQAKELYPDTVRMVLSGYADLQSITDAINEGAIYKFLSKPWDDEMLKAEIDEAFRRKALKDENKRLSEQVRMANAELVRLNAQLQDALAVQQQRTELGETALAAVQEIVNFLPVPLLGVDPDGLLVFANAEAMQRFAHIPLLGTFVSEALPREVADLVTQGQGEALINIDQSSYRVRCNAVDSIMMQRGHLLVFIPDSTP